MLGRECVQQQVHMVHMHVTPDLTDLQSLSLEISVP